MMYSIKAGNEVYVYLNGHLIYKKWLDRNQSVVFNDLPVWKTECEILTSPTTSATEMRKEIQVIRSCSHCGKTFDDGEEYLHLNHATAYCLDNDCDWEEEYYGNND